MLDSASHLNLLIRSPVTCNRYSQLDKFLISTGDSHRVSECNIEPITISDHAPVWRLNVSLLNDEKIKQVLQKSLTEYFELNKSDTISPSTLLEGSKAVMRGNVIAISS